MRLNKPSSSDPAKIAHNSALQTSPAKAEAERGKGGDGGRALFEEYSHLPWHVYGEGEPPPGWQSVEQSRHAGTLAEQIQDGLVPAKPPQGWTLGNLLTGVLQRGIKVRISPSEQIIMDASLPCCNEQLALPSEAMDQLEAHPTRKAGAKRNLRLQIRISSRTLKLHYAYCVRIGRLNDSADDWQLR